MKISRIYVSACRRDWHLARLCIASIRHWYPRFPIWLIKDLHLGDFDTEETERRHGLKRFQSKASAFGYGFSKLEPLFLPRVHRYLMLDADLLVLGPVLEFFNRSKADFVIHPETNGLEHTESLAYRLAPLAALDPDYRHPDLIFNSGNYVATSGRLHRADFDGLIRWEEPRCLVHPDIFKCGDQGVMNYVLFKARQEGRLTVDLLDYYMWSGLGAPGITVEGQRSRQSPPHIIHWAGPKAPRIEDMPRADLLRFYQELAERPPSTGLCDRVRRWLVRAGT